MQDTTEQKQYQCRRIFTDGHRCASPCLRAEQFCYYHHTTRKPVADPKQRRTRRSTFHLAIPDPNDRSGIQLAIGEVLQRIAANDIDPRRAGLLLYGLQIASLNLPKPQPAQATGRETASHTVEEITIDPTLGILAPKAEVAHATQRRSAVALLLEEMLAHPASDNDHNRHQVGPQEPNTLPALQATADVPISSRCRHQRRVVSN